MNMPMLVCLRGGREVYVPECLLRRPGADLSSKKGHYSLTQFKLKIKLLHTHQGASLSMKLVAGKCSSTAGEIPSWVDTPSSSNWAVTPGP